jgi:signal transduction histidine kinase
LNKRGRKTLEPYQIGFAMNTEIEDEQLQPGSLLCLHLFRIYHEALTNVIKHAKATNVVANLQVKQNWLTLLIRDNGVGCNETIFSGKGRGVTNIQKRAAEIGGVVGITGDKGTCLFVEIPLAIQSGPAGGRGPG